MKSLILICLVTFIISEDFYDILGVDRNTSAKDLKSAYRRLSQKYHPDKNPGDNTAQKRFIEITKAYETLSDPEKRQIYDLYGEEGLSKESQISESRKPRGHNAHVEIDVDLEDLYNGSVKQFTISKNVVCEQCHGTGGKLGATHQCPKCKGRGQVIEQMQTGMGFTFQVQNTCNRCNGKGVVFKESCPSCQGRRIKKQDQTLTLTIEKGMKNKEKIVFHKEAEQHPDYTPGDLVITLNQKKHHFFTERKGDDLYANMKLSLEEALLGYDRSFAHLDGRQVLVKRTKPTQPFEIRSIEGEGMPIHNFSSQKGILYLKHIVTLPEYLTEEEKSLVEKMFN